MITLFLSDVTKLYHIVPSLGWNMQQSRGLTSLLPGPKSTGRAVSYSGKKIKTPPERTRVLPAMPIATLSVDLQVKC